MSARVEYRVRWRRDFHGADQTRIYQSRKAAERRALLVQGRMAEATGEDPAAVACLGGAGQYCGCPTTCRERTNAEVWDERGAEIPSLVMGPVIEQRTVGEWGPA